MNGHILVINGGSSSIRFKLFNTQCQDIEQVLSGAVSGIGTKPRIAIKSSELLPFLAPQDLPDVKSHADAIDAVLDWLNMHGVAENLVAAGHRIVHGGGRYSEPIVLNDTIVSELDSFASLAPHHQPHNLAAILALSQRLPDLPQVGCFDTGFHETMPATAKELGLPRAYRAEGLRRYGFHGLSYAYLSSAFSEIVNQPLAERVVIAHLGNGASLCALRGGKSIATTMGFSTLDGLAMGTRSGSIDPGALLYLLKNKAMTPEKVEKLLYDKCGLKGLSELTSDMRELLASEGADAAEAIEYYCYRIVREIGSLAAALGGIDMLIFSGGVGENAWQIRSKILKQLAWLGFEIEESANKKSEKLITTPDNKPSAWVVPTDEEKYIAQQTLSCLTRAQSDQIESDCAL